MATRFWKALYQYYQAWNYQVLESSPAITKWTKVIDLILSKSGWIGLDQGSTGLLHSISFSARGAQSWNSSRSLCTDHYRHNTYKLILDSDGRKCYHMISSYFLLSWATTVASTVYRRSKTVMQVPRQMNTKHTKDDLLQTVFFCWGVRIYSVIF